MVPLLMAAKSKLANTDSTKKVALGLGVVITATVLYFVFRKNKDQAAQEEIAQNTQETINNMSLDKGNLSIDSNKASIISTGLFNAMNRLGCDYKTVWTLLEPLNSDDIKLVIKRFGVRNYRWGGLSTSKKAKALDLLGWLKEEMKTSPWYWPKVRQKFQEASIPF